MQERTPQQQGQRHAHGGGGAVLGECTKPTPWNRHGAVGDASGDAEGDVQGARGLSAELLGGHAGIGEPLQS